MALTFTKLFQPTQLGVANATIYTMPTNPASSLMRNGRVLLVNTTGNAATVTLNAVPSSGSASVSNQFLSAVSIGPNSSLPVDVPELAAGDTIQGLAGTASAITIHAMDGVIYS